MSLCTESCNARPHCTRHITQACNDTYAARDRVLAAIVVRSALKSGTSYARETHKRHDNITVSAHAKALLDHAHGGVRPARQRTSASAGMSRFGVAAAARPVPRSHQHP